MLRVCTYSRESVHVSWELKKQKLAHNYHKELHSLRMRINAITCLVNYHARKTRPWATCTWPGKEVRVHPAVLESLLHCSHLNVQWSANKSDHTNINSDDCFYGRSSASLWAQAMVHRSQRFSPLRYISMLLTWWPGTPCCQKRVRT